MCIHSYAYWSPARILLDPRKKAQPTANDRKAQLHRTLLVFDSSVNRVKDSWYGLIRVAATKDVKTVNL